MISPDDAILNDFEGAKNEALLDSSGLSASVASHVQCAGRDGC